MIHTTTYKSPLGNITLAAKDGSLIGAWFEGQKYYLSGIREEMTTNNAYPVLIKTCEWLERYFNSECPIPSELPLAPSGTEFQHRVWDILLQIPYSQTTSYGAIAKKLAAEMGISRMSAQAVGGAVGHNPISIIIPCHRVIGTKKALTGYAGGQTLLATHCKEKALLVGYAGGLDKKIWLLKHERAQLTACNVY